MTPSTIRIFVGDDDPPYENALAEELYRAFAASSNNKGYDLLSN